MNKKRLAKVIGRTIVLSAADTTLAAVRTVHALNTAAGRVLKNGADLIIGKKARRKVSKKLFHRMNEVDKAANTDVINTLRRARIWAKGRRLKKPSSGLAIQ